MSDAEISQIEAGNLFNVNGLVAVITGGGSGLCHLPAFPLLQWFLCHRVPLINPHRHKRQERQDLSENGHPRWLNNLSNLSSIETLLLTLMDDTKATANVLRRTRANDGTGSCSKRSIQSLHHRPS